MKTSIFIFLTVLFTSINGWANTFSHMKGEGLKVTSVSPSFEKAGLRVNDIILQVANHQLANVNNLRPALEVLNSGREVFVVIKRRGLILNANVQLVR